MSSCVGLFDNCGFIVVLWENKTGIICPLQNPLVTTLVIKCVWSATHIYVLSTFTIQSKFSNTQTQRAETCYFSKFLKQSAAVFCEMMSCTIIVISDWRSRATVGTTSETHQSLQKGWWPTRAICRFFNLVQKQTMTLQIFSFQIDFAQNFYNMSENDWVAQVKAPPKIKTR